MPRLSFRGSLLLGALVLLLVPSAAATTAVEMNSAALTSSAETILIGVCTDIQTEWVGRVLVTRATVSVSEYLKGSGAETMVVTLPGGSDANRRIPVAMNFPGAPELRIGEKTFLFLVGDEVYGPTIAGFSQGKFSINRDLNGEELVSRDLTQIRLATGTGVVRGTASKKKLSEFKAEIQSLISEPVDR
jgi:hypothetical protein